MTDQPAAALAGAYLGAVTDLMTRIRSEEEDAVTAAAGLLASHIAQDRLVHVYGPGGHSNLAAQEVFFRAGGLMHLAAILDEGTLLSGGALRSMAIERNPGYGRIVIDSAGLGDGDLLILVNAYGINAALIDAALTASERGCTVIGVSSRPHADSTAPDHPARHPSKKNLHEVVDMHIDTKVPVGDAVLEIDGVAERTGAVSTFANAFTMNWLMATTVALLAERGIDPPIWRSGNAPGGDEANNRFIADFAGRVRWL
ncbi:sugar isomerase domain-containing protein [Brachybacterium sp. MASK1Z-5]|uniref:Sugar isomerase domain-containing protein n=1 Tax=Brachybacterium halotolerans TaxID=2795215 RepID=A0ABS1BAQ9_9MICO|nr:sugar isomerase domain-containing protein [Brachybacterium halotolerans]MBK0331567.1 sugar isomerase domain-containing protein [Brachybacterium halotolerans]